MFPEYLKRAKKEVKVLQSFVQHIGHSYAAFYEFKYFSLMYLKRASEKYPDIFKSTLENGSLREVYTKVHHRYSALIQHFDSLLVEIVGDLNSQGLRSEIRDGYFWIGEYGVGIMNEDVDKLQNTLSEISLQKLNNQFIIPEMY